MYVIVFNDISSNMDFDLIRNKITLFVKLGLRRPNTLTESENIQYDYIMLKCIVESLANIFSLCASDFDPEKTTKIKLICAYS